MAQETENWVVKMQVDENDVISGVGRADKTLENFKKRSEKARKVQITANIARLQQKMDEARKQLRYFKKTGDKEGQITARIKILKFQQNVTKLRKSLRDLEKQANKTKKGFLRLNGIVKDALKVALGFGIFRAIAGFFRSAALAALEFDRAFVGVRKTLEGTDAQFKELRGNLQKMSQELGVSANEIARIAELGGQLGIGIENIEEFASTITQITKATNLTAEDASLAFSRIASVTNLPIENVENLASSIVELGNNFAATEREITTFTERIAGAGAVVGLTAQDLAGISTAFVSVGIEAEAGGTAVQKVLLKMNEAVVNGGEELEKFGILTGKTGEEFAELFRTDAAGAFEEFVGGLQDSGEDAVKVIDALIGSDVRLQRAFLSVASAGDTLSRSIDTANRAFEENRALTEENERRLNSLSGRADKVKAAFERVKITIGTFIVERLLPLAEAITGSDEKLNDFIQLLLGKMVAAVRKATQIILLFIAALDAIPFVDMSATINEIGKLILKMKEVEREIKKTSFTLDNFMGKVTRVTNSAMQKIASAPEEVKKKFQQGIDYLKKFKGELEKSKPDIEKIVGGGDSKAGGGGVGSAVSNTIKGQEKAIEDAKDELEDYIKEYDDLSEKVGDISDDINDFYEDVIANIRKAKEEQKSLTDSLKEYGEEVDKKTAGDLGERDVDLEKEQKEKERSLLDLNVAHKNNSRELGKARRITEEIKRLEEEAAGGEDERTRRRAAIQIDKLKEKLGGIESENEGITDIIELEERLLEIAKERATIADYIAQIGGGEAFSKEKEFQGLSRSEQIIESAEGKKGDKSDEVQKEIDGQQRIIDLQEKFLEIMNSSKTKVKAARAVIANELQKGILADQEKVNQEFENLGLSDLTREEQQNLEKQLLIGQTLDYEKNALTLQQEELLRVREDYNSRIETAFADSVDRQKDKMNELINVIKRAQREQIRLNSLRGASGAAVTNNNSNTTNNSNLKITQNINNSVDAEAAVNAIVKKVK